MINELKKEVEGTYGKKVENRGDCEKIANAILELLDIEISYNTIRRLFELAPFTNPNKKTLNTLAKFVGYNNYFHFTQTYIFKDKTNLFQITYKHIYDENDLEIINLIKNTRKGTEYFIDFITLVVRELFYLKKYELIDSIFKLEELKYSRFSYMEILYFGNSIGLILRKENKVNEVLAKNINFLKCVYLIFVDYSSLNSYYGKWTKTLKDLKKTTEIEVFNLAISEFKRFLNKKKLNNNVEELVYNKNLHPILCGRLIALQLLSKNVSNPIEALTKYCKFHPIKKHFTDYFYELFTTSILTKNIGVMKFIIQNINFKIMHLYQKEHLNSYYLMSAFYYRITHNKVKQLTNYNRFNINGSRNSYDEFIKLLNLIYLYGATTKWSEKKQILKQYELLSEKLNYPYFSNEFLLNYFE
jgi:hypothetical protein